ncbi:MAG: hypothetical protein KF744_03815 [Taibaiella sp.]|nr:hypothetical protein [Taibaiella sp.]
MYRISDEHVDYILDDLVAKGIDMEDLQLNLLDHICCIIERELEDGGNFERFYHDNIRRFYNKELREIEEETINLLTFKNYYAMRKVLIGSGVFAVAAFMVGSLFKYMYWPGANILLVLGMVTFSLLFLPLLFILKSREARERSDKFVVGIGTLTGVLFSLAILFIVQHWPGANVLLFLSMGIAAFVLLPVYFFTGIRRPETKLNTILMSVILVGTIGLHFTMARLRPSHSQLAIATVNYVQGEALLGKMLSVNPPSPQLAEIQSLAAQVKAMVLQRYMGSATVPADFEVQHIYLRDGTLGPEFSENAAGVQLLRRLNAAIAGYEGSSGDTAIAGVLRQSVLNGDPSETGKRYTSMSLLNSISQVQMYLALPQQGKMAAK